MDNQRKCLQIGAVAIICAVLLRLMSLGIPAFGSAREQVLSAVLLLGAGRVVKLSQPQPTQPELSATQAPAEPTIPPEQKTTVTFTDEDVARIQLRNTSGYNIDTVSLLQQPLTWALSGDAPSVLILHTHGSESYTKTEDYTESASYRTLDNNYNVVSIGTYIAQQLEASGIRVIHDRTLHDQPSYNGSYAAARSSIAQYLQQYPSIQLVLDIHRDAAVDDSGQQIGTTVSTAQGDCAQLMLVMGTDAGGLDHSQWQQNLSLAVKLHALLERQQPGICRPMQVRTSRFNQDLCPGALLVEVGAAGNTRQEAMTAAGILAQQITALAYGT